MAEVIVVHGYPGSGKTTQCARVASEGLGSRTVQHVSVGNRLRAIRSHAVQSKYSGYINSPDAPPTLPEEIIRGALFESFHNIHDDDILLIDGYPRFSHALDDFYTALSDNDHQLLGAVHLGVSLDTSIERVALRSRRTDKGFSEETLESNAVFRYNRHRQTTLITLMAINATFPVEEIDGSGDKDEVHDRFVTALGRLVLKAGITD